MPPSERRAAWLIRRPRIAASATASASESAPAGGRAAKTSRSTPYRDYSGTFLGRKAQPLRALDGLGAVGHAELAVQRARVLLHRVRRQVEPARDLAVGRSGRDQLEHLALA